MIFSTRQSVMEKEQKKKKKQGSLILLVLLFISGYFIFSKIFTKNTDTTGEEKAEKSVEEEEVVEIAVKSEFKAIDGESIYIAFDENAKENSKFPMVIYSHGSTYTVSESPSNPLTEDLDYYADMFVKSGYIFAASNQHGDNWGNATAIEDTKKLIDFVNSDYKGNGDVYLLGFSMGGLVTMNYAEKYPENVRKIALLAPAPEQGNYWNSTRVENIKEIPIRIWHGDRDGHVTYDNTTALIKKLKSLGKEIELITVEGASHFDVDTEFTDAIVEFYKSH